MSDYGTCPKCGADGVSRERRPNGNDVCAKGCVYPSTEAMPPAPKETPQPIMMHLHIYVNPRERVVDQLRQVVKCLEDGGSFKHLAGNNFEFEFKELAKPTVCKHTSFSERQVMDMKYNHCDDCGFEWKQEGPPLVDPWYVVDRADSSRVCGPFATSEEAADARNKLELNPGEHRNLWITIS